MYAQQQQKDYGTEVIVDGRIVWGDVTLKPKKNFKTKAIEIDPKTNKEVMEVAFGVAIPKINGQMSEIEKNNFNQIWTAIHTEAYKCGVQYPNDNFAWKFHDGDTNKADGTPRPDHEKGCIILSCSTRIPLNLFKRVTLGDGSVVHQQLTPADFKTGDYVRVNINIKGHTGTNAGLYINPNGVLFLAAGEAIQSASASPTQMFGSAPFAIPQNIMNGQQPQMMAPPQMQPPMQQGYPQNPQTYQQPMQQQMAPPAPNMNVLPPQFQQQAPPMQQPQYQQQMAPPQQPMMQQQAPQNGGFNIPTFPINQG